MRTTLTYAFIIVILLLVGAVLATTQQYDVTLQNGENIVLNSTEPAQGIRVVGEHPYTGNHTLWYENTSAIYEYVEKAFGTETVLDVKTNTISYNVTCEECVATNTQISADTTHNITVTNVSWNTLQAQQSSNTAPTQTAPTLTASTPQNYSRDNLSLSTNVSDLEGNSTYIITDWRADNESIALLNYAFDGNQTYTDHSSNQNHATPNNANIVPGQRGDGIAFNGVNTTVVPQSQISPPSQGTVMYWMKNRSNPTQTWERIWGVRDDFENRIRSGGTVEFDICLGGSYVQSSKSSWTDKEWHHIAYTWNEATGEYAIVINGAVDREGTASFSCNTTQGTLTVGTRTGSTPYFNGTLDDFVLYDEALSVDHIQSIYDDEMNHTSLDASVVTPGNWSVQVTPSDGALLGTTKSSTTVEVTTTPTVTIHNPPLTSTLVDTYVIPYNVTTSVPGATSFNVTLSQNSTVIQTAETNQTENTGSFTVNTTGTYAINATVRSTNNQTFQSTTHTVIITQNQPPTLTANVSTTEARTSIPLSLTTNSSDPENDTVTHTYDWNENNEPLTIHQLSFESILNGTKLPVHGGLQDTYGEIYGGNLTEGLTGRGFTFDEVDDKIIIPDFDFGPTFTLNFWMYLEEMTGSSRQYIYDHRGGGEGLRIYIAEESESYPKLIRICLYRASDNGNCELSYIWGSEWNFNEWTMVTLRVDPEGIHLFINSEKYWSGSSDNAAGPINPTGPLYIGGRNDNASNRYFGGNLDQVMLFNTSLSDDTITDLYTAPYQNFEELPSHLTTSGATYNATVHAHDNVTVTTTNTANATTVGTYEWSPQTTQSGTYLTQQHSFTANTKNFTVQNLTITKNGSVVTNTTNQTIQYNTTLTPGTYNITATLTTPKNSFELTPRTIEILTNQPPTLNVSLIADSPNTQANLTATVNVSDPEAENTTVSYTWKKNGAYYEKLHLPIGHDQPITTITPLRNLVGNTTFIGTPGTQENTPKIRQNAARDYYLEFNADQFLNGTLPANTLFNPEGTISFWVYINQSPSTSYPRIFDFADSSDNRHIIFGYDDDEDYNFFFQHVDDSGSSMGYETTSVPTNTWHHIALTYNRNQGAPMAYINGVAEEMSNYYGNVNRDNRSTQIDNVVIGALRNAAFQSTYFNGYLDNIRFYDTILSDAEIQQLSQENHSFIPEEATRAPQNWTVQATPHDPYQAGPSTDSNTITIAVPPSPTITNITPATATNKVTPELTIQTTTEANIASITATTTAKTTTICEVCNATQNKGEAFLTEGTNQVNITVTDEFGQTTTQQHNITVHLNERLTEPLFTDTIYTEKQGGTTDNQLRLTGTDTYREATYTQNTSKILTTDTDGHPLTQLFLGPTPGSTESNFGGDQTLIACNGETAVAINASNQTYCSEQNTSWFTSRDGDGQFDYTSLFSKTTNVHAYSKTYVWSPQTQNANILIGKDDRANIWVNEEKVWEDLNGEGVTRDDYTVPITLQGGWNKIVTRVAQGSGGWGVAWRITDTANQGLRLNYTLSHPAEPETASYTTDWINLTEPFRDLTIIPATQRSEEATITYEIQRPHHTWRPFTGNTSRSYNLSDAFQLRINASLPNTTTANITSLNITWSNTTNLPDITGFDGNTTDFETVDIENVENLTVEKTGNARITWTQPVNASNADLPITIDLGTNYAYVNSTALHPTFNQTATITWPGTNADQIAVYKDGAPCTACTVQGTNPITVDVPGFSNYTYTTSSNNTNYWTCSTQTTFTNNTCWSKGTTPTQGEYVVFNGSGTGNVIVENNTLPQDLAAFTVENTYTGTIVFRPLFAEGNWTGRNDGTQEWNVTGDITINNGTVEVWGDYRHVDFTGVEGNITAEGHGQIWNSNTGTIMIGQNAKVNGKGHGFPKGTGPAGATSPLGGSHGGIGGGDSGFREPYGNATHPTSIGSGGWDGDGGDGSGGAGLKLDATTVHVNGEIDVSGANRGRRTGAGGSIWVVADTFSGDGQLLADAGVVGVTSSATGGGGRIRVSYQDSLNYTGNISMWADNGGTAGTLTFTNNTWPTDLNLTGDIGFLGGDFGEGDAINILGDFNTNGFKVSIYGDCFGYGSSYDAFTCYNTVPEGQGVWINATGDIHVDANTEFDGQRLGFPRTVGPGASNGIHAATHGGRGAGNGDTVYGSKSEPTSLGSGGRDFEPSFGGAAIKLQSTGNLVFDGDINVRPNGANRAGSPGSAWLKAPNISGKGSIYAFGAGGMGSGGGRIAVTGNNINLSGTLNASGGDPSDNDDGSGGSIFINASNTLRGNFSSQSRGYNGDKSTVDWGQKINLISPYMHISGNHSTTVYNSSLSVVNGQLNVTYSNCYSKLLGNFAGTTTYDTPCTVPTQTRPTITAKSTLPSNITVVSQNVTDASNDSVETIYDWRLNETSIARLNLPFALDVPGGATSEVQDFSTYQTNASLPANSSTHPTWNMNASNTYYSFDGNDYISIPNTTADELSNELTITAWIRSSSFSNGSVLGSSRANSNNGLAFGFNNDNLRFTSFSIQDYDSNITPPTNQWTQVAVVMDTNNDANFYLDGVYHETVTGTSPVSANTDDEFRIGALSPTGGGTAPYKGFNGDVADLKIYDRALSAEQIARLHSEETPLTTQQNQSRLVSQETTPSDQWIVAVTTSDGVLLGTTKETAQLGNPVCGESITTDVILTGNMTCPADAIVVDTQNIDVNCRNHWLKPTQRGIHFQNDAQGFTATNCNVRGGTGGIQVQNSNGAMTNGSFINIGTALSVGGGGSGLNWAGHVYFENTTLGLSGSVNNFLNITFLNATVNDGRITVGNGDNLYLNGGFTRTGSHAGGYIRTTEGTVHLGDGLINLSDNTQPLLGAPTGYSTLVDGNLANLQIQDSYQDGYDLRGTATWDNVYVQEAQGGTTFRIFEPFTLDQTNSFILGTSGSTHLDIYENVTADFGGLTLNDSTATSYIVNLRGNNTLKNLYITGTAPGIEAITTTPVTIQGITSDTTDTSFYSTAPITTIIDSNLTGYSFSSTNLIIHETNKARITYADPVTSSGNNLKSDVQIGKTWVYVNSSQSGLNATAELMYYGSYTNPVLLRDGTPCTPATKPTCNFTQSNNTRATFNVSSFSNYSVTNNTAPTHHEPLLQSTFTQNTTDENLTVTPQNVSDAENQTIHYTYDWRENGTSLAILQYPFNTDVNETVLDYTTYDINASLGQGVESNKPEWIYDCVVGGCYRFDGVNDRIDVPADDSQRLTENITIMAWVRQEGENTAQTGVILDNWGSPNAFYFDYEYGTNQLRWTATNENVSVDDQRLEPTVNLNLDQWYHVAATYNGSVKRVFVDGQVVGEEFVNHTIRNRTPTYTIGDTWNGSIDEWKVYDKGLSEDQVYQVYYEENISLSTESNKKSTLHTAETERNNTYEVSVTPNDGYTEGTTKKSNNVTIISDGSPPQLANLSIVSKTNETVTLLWVTDEAGNHTVNYGTTTSLGSTKNNASYVNNHTTTLTGLSSNTTYYYNVTVCDDAGNCKENGSNTFKTYPTPGTLNVTLTYPSTDITVKTGRTFTANSTITCLNNPCGNVSFGVKRQTGEDSNPLILAGSMTTQNNEWVWVPFNRTYEVPPVIIATPASQNAGASEDDNGLIATIKQVNETGFNATICADNGVTTCDTTTATETLHWYAINRNKSQNKSWIATGVEQNVPTSETETSISWGKTLNNAPYVFTTPQTYNQAAAELAATTWERGVASTTGATIVACTHQGTGDSCDGGNPAENVGWLAIDPSTQNISGLQTGTADISGSSWTSATLSPSISNPIVGVAQNSESGGQDPKYPWARSVTSTGFDFRYCEQDGTDRCDGHNAETVRWIAMNTGFNSVPGDEETSLTLQFVNTTETTPFYTTNHNPYTYQNNSCLENMGVGASCTFTWKTYITGTSNETNQFFTEANSTQPLGKAAESTKVNLSIHADTPPAHDTGSISTPSDVSGDTEDENITASSVNLTDNESDTIALSYDWRRNNVSLARVNLPFNTELYAYEDLSTDNNSVNGSSLGGTEEPVWEEFGKVGGSLHFNASTTDQFVTVEDYPKYKEVTYSLWVHPQSYPGSQSIAVLGSYGGENGGGYVAYHDVDITKSTEEVNFFVSCASGDEILTGPTIPRDTWTHIGATWNQNSGEAALYVNGQQEANTTTCYNSTSPNSYKYTFGALGHNNLSGQSNYGFTGYLDEVKIYNETLKPAQIRQIYEDENKTSGNLEQPNSTLIAPFNFSDTYDAEITPYGEVRGATKQTETLVFGAGAAACTTNAECSVGYTCQEDLYEGTPQTKACCTASQCYQETAQACYNNGETYGANTCRGGVWINSGGQLQIDSSRDELAAITSSSATLTTTGSEINDGYTASEVATKNCGQGTCDNTNSWNAGYNDADPANVQVDWVFNTGSLSDVTTLQLFGGGCWHGGTARSCDGSDDAEFAASSDQLNMQVYDFASQQYITFNNYTITPGGNGNSGPGADYRQYNASYQVPDSLDVINNSEMRIRYNIQETMIGSNYEVQGVYDYINLTLENQEGTVAAVLDTYGSLAINGSLTESCTPTTNGFVLPNATTPSIQISPTGNLCVADKLITRNTGTTCTSTKCVEIQDASSTIQARFYENGTLFIAGELGENATFT